ncbi:MAG: HDIG domain-containing protein [Clostridia bacterium]
MSFCFTALVFAILTFKTSGVSGNYFDILIQKPLQSAMVFLLIVVIMSLSFVVLSLEAAAKKHPLRSQAVILFAMSLTIVLSVIADMYFGRYSRPIALAGVFIAVIINKRSAIYSNIAIAMIFIVIEGLIHGFSVPIIVPSIHGMFAGVIMSIMVSRDDTRLKTVFTVVELIPIYMALMCLFYFAFYKFDAYEFQISLLQVAISPIFSGFVFLGVLPIFEALFKIVTPYYLTELTDINKGLLARLSKEAPGNFNNSLAVANLSGACALALGEDVRLVRAMAYYHDIGKLSDPSVFKENLISDEQNPHDKLTPELSVSLIKKHVSYGVELLKKKGLPAEIINAAAEHHGTLPLKFFYYKAMKFSEGAVNLDNYSYEGPTPTSKLTAILMIVDGCEAAVRTLPDRNRQKVDEVVKSIIEERMELEQFDNCDITFRDLQTIRTTLVDNFAGIYHERIAYPKFKVSKNQVDTEDKQ